MSLRIRSARFSRGAPSRAIQPRLRRRRFASLRGFTLVELLVVISIIGMLMALLLPAIQNAYETGRQNTCRNNLRNLSIALFNYSNRNNVYPGYMNALQRDDGTLYVDPQTSIQTPVSWVVMILSDIDRAPLWDQWRKNYLNQQSGGGSGSTSTYIPNTKIYIDLLVCPSDPQPNKNGTPTAYVVNTGCQDMAVGAGGGGGGGGGGGSGGTGSSSLPRDNLANGMFFDNYTSHPLMLAAQGGTGGGSSSYVAMAPAAVRDPKDKTILLTENVDAVNYTFDNSAMGGGGGGGGGGSGGGAMSFQYAEVEMGCIWDHLATIIPPAGQGQPPTMTPTVNSKRINNDIGLGDGINYNYCRPSSRHPQGVNVAFVGQNVLFLKDTINYAIYAKLMSSDDSKMQTPGVTPAQLLQDSVRLYQMTDADVNP